MVQMQKHSSQTPTEDSLHYNSLMSSLLWYGTVTDHRKLDLQTSSNVRKTKLTSDCRKSQPALENEYWTHLLGGYRVGYSCCSMHSGCFAKTLAITT